MRHAFRYGASISCLALSFITAVGCDSTNDPLPRVFADNSTPTPNTNVWPGWRGGEQHGRSLDVGFRARWDLRNHQRWSLAIPGTGNSSPIVWGNWIFVTTTVTEKSTGQTQFSLICIQRDEGTIAWQRSLGRPSNKTHHKNGFASATPATDGQRVFVSGGSMGLFCFDFHGKQVWRRDLGHMPHQWGSASSPLVVGNLVVQLTDSEQDSSLQAFDRVTGERVWRTLRISQGCWSTPVLLRNREQGLQIVVNGTGTKDGSAGSIIAYSPQDGQELWRVMGTSDIPCPTAIVSGNWLVSSSGNNGPILGIEVGKRPQVRWSAPSGGPYVPTGLVYGKWLFLISDNGVLSCRQKTNGELVWRHRFRDSFSSSLVAAQNQIYAVSERGRVYVVAARDKFELLARNDLGAPTTATPALVNGEIFIRTSGKLHCILPIGK